MKYYSEDQVREMLQDQKTRIGINIINHSLKPTDVSINFPEFVYEGTLPDDVIYQISHSPQPEL